MAPKAKKAQRSHPRKPSSDSSPNTEENPRHENGSSKPSLATPGKEQKPGSKKRKKEREKNGNPTSAEKKKVGTRDFTDEDEIAILQGMLDCRLSIATKELRKFLEGKLSDDFSSSQLYEKARRFKEKLVKNMEHADSLKAHDALIFDLCNRIWGKDKILVDNCTDSNKKMKKNVPRKSPTKVAGDRESNCRASAKNEPRKSPMQVAGGRENSIEDSAKNRLLEEIECLVKKYELKAELAKLDYEEMKKR